MSGKNKPGDSGDLQLEGHFLIAMPGMGDPRFDHGLIYVCAHSDAGSMGFVVNHPLESPTFPSLLTQLEIRREDDIGELPDEVLSQPVYYGGPVEQARGFVLHSPDYESEATLLVNNSLALTATLDALKSLSGPGGPRRSLLLLGYAGWAGGQLEQEILRNGWLTCEADTDIVFHPDPAAKYDLALQALGIDAGFLSADAGRA